MEKLLKMSIEEWLIDKQIPMEVAESFEGGYTKGSYSILFLVLLDAASHSRIWKTETDLREGWLPVPQQAKVFASKAYIKLGQGMNLSCMYARADSAIRCEPKLIFNLTV